MNKTRLVCLAAGLFVLGTVLFPTVTSASVGVSPASLNFGSVTVNTSSAAATLVVTNTSRGSITLDKISCTSPDFVVTGPTLPLNLGGHQSESFHVVFLPTTAATFSGNITINAGRRGGIFTSIPVSGTGIAPAVQALTYLLTPSVANLSFANLVVGSAASQGFTLTNTGTGSVTISQVAAAGAGFSVSGFSSAVSLAAGQSLSLAVGFAPSATGSVSGSISVVSSATNSPASITLSGTGVQPLLSVVPSSVSFGNVTVGVTNSQTMTIQNPGTASLTVTQASLSGASYSMSGLALPLSVAPGASVAFNISFGPASASSLPGSLTLVSNAPTSPTNIALAGTGIAQVLQLSASPASLSFASLATGTSASQSITVTNTGNSAVAISQITASGAGFSTNSVSLPISLAAGQSTSISVTCAPASAGTLTGSLTVTSNAANSPLTVALTGTATAPTYSVNLTWTPSSSSYEGFNIYRGSVSGGPYTKMDASLIASPSYADSTVTAGQTYYYVATEVDSSGNESAYSTETAATVP
jgi:Abnormal spindle-like microcephaly-assoc'd, ASPM-SPD-2-Hydin